MSLFSRAFAGGFEARTFQGFRDFPSPLEDGLGNDGTGSHGAMSISVFFSCVRILCDTVASLPVKIYRQEGDVAVEVSPQPLLFKGSPFPGMTMFTWMAMLTRSLAVTGNGLGYVSAYSPDGRATGILPLHPDCVEIVSQLDEDPSISWTNPIYKINGKQVDSKRIMHIKRYPEAGLAAGLSPVQQLATTIGLTLAADRYGLRYFKDSANPSGLLTSDLDLTPAQVKQAQKSWTISHQGRRLPAVLGGGLKWQPVTITPEESQFLATRAFQRTEITMLFGIPPHMLGDTEKSTSYGKGIEDQTIGFVTYTLVAWLECIQQAMSMFLPNGQFMEFNIDGLLRGDVKARWEAYGLGRNAGVYSVNDINAMEGMPPIGPEGDIRLQPMNFIPLGTPLSAYPGQGNAPGEIEPS